MTDKQYLAKLLECSPYLFVIGRLGDYEAAAANLIANGVRLERKQATSDENKRWIPVSERLPEDDRQVLACTKKGKAFSAHYDHKWKSWSVSHTVKITHWMPLPRPPKEVDDD